MGWLNIVTHLLNPVCDIREGLNLKNKISIRLNLGGGGRYRATKVSVETVGASQRMAHIDRIWP